MFEGRSGFHESYYEHSCTDLNEQDVLYTAIKQNWLAGCKRWWYNLFLLSYNDERCRIYYTSSHTMRLERMKQFHYYRDRIHPLSSFSNFWSLFLLITVLSNRIIFHHNTTTFFIKMPIIFSFIAVILELIIIIDVFLNFKMGYIDKQFRRIVLNAKKARIHYVSTKLFFYVCCAVPLQTIMLLRYGLNIECNRCKTNRFVCVLKICGLVSLYRVFECTTYWTRDRNTFTLTYLFKFLRIFCTGFITMLQLLNVSEAVSTLILIQSNEIDPKSYLASMIRLKYWQEISEWKLLAIELSFISKSILLFGQGLTRKTYYLDAVIGLLVFISANVFYIWGLVEFYTVINRQMYSEEQMNIHRDRTMNVMRSRNLSNSISAKLDKYYDFNMTRLRLIEQQNDLYHFLPSAQRKEIKLSCYTRYVKRIPYFSEWPAKVLEGIVLLLKEEVFLKHDIVADMWTQRNGLVILYVGMMAVYSADGKEVGHLIGGDYFGELTLVTNKEILSSSVIAITPCMILQLPKTAFREYMESYPDLFTALRKQMHEIFNAGGKVTMSARKAQDMMEMMKKERGEQKKVQLS